jgi:hypothetical protein
VGAAVKFLKAWTIACWLLSLLLVSQSAFAQFTRDKSANEKIDQAINEHYLATNFDEARDLLQGIIEACEDKCSPGVKAKAYMYLGIVLFNGKNDAAGAKEAFVQARKIDPKVKLDEGLANPETKKLFDGAGGGAAAPAPEPTPPKPEEKSGEPERTKGENMSCSPDIEEAAAGRPIPFSCTAPAGTTVELRFLAPGEDKYKLIKMRAAQGEHQAMLPCSATRKTGELRVYIKAKSGDKLMGRIASKAKPLVIQLVKETGEPAASYPGQPAPEPCGAVAAAPAPEEKVEDGDKDEGEKQTVKPPPPKPKQEGEACTASTQCESGLECKAGACFRKKEAGGACKASDECVDGLECKAGACFQRRSEGDSCKGNDECSSGLECRNGECKPPPSCMSDADCSIGSCVDGECRWTQFVGLHFAQDLRVGGGSQACSPASQGDRSFTCYFADEDADYVGSPYGGGPDYPGLALATQRLLLSYELDLKKHISVGGRLGFAFAQGSPDSFLPVHVEARVSYTLGSSKKLRPYVGIGGGLAQVDSKSTVTIQECNEWAGHPDPMSSDPQGDLARDRAACARGDSQVVGQGDFPDIPNHEVDAFSSLGLAFAGLHGGVLYALSDQVGLQGNLNLMLMIPSVGFVMEPSVGILFTPAGM